MGAREKNIGWLSQDGLPSLPMTSGRDQQFGIIDLDWQSFFQEEKAADKQFRIDAVIAETDHCPNNLCSFEMSNLQFLSSTPP
jgi:hypothetical protein